jgi:hydrogenase nickel incorporation protein HypA/HybF
MHEIGYCAGVLKAVERRAAGRPVARIGVLVGALHRISPAAFQQSFHLVADGGIAAGAGTEVLIAPVRASCTACRAAFESTDAAPVCPECHSTEVAAEGGDELVLQWVEYAQAQDGAGGGAGAREHAEAVTAVASEHAAAVSEAARERADPVLAAAPESTAAISGAVREHAETVPAAAVSVAAREHADAVPAVAREHADPVLAAAPEHAAAPVPAAAPEHARPTPVAVAAREDH